jgi:RNA polymerase sigma-70 factor
MNQEKIASLLMRHNSVIYGYILACLRNCADADDVLQEVTVAAIRSDVVPPTDADFLRWVREVARRRVLEFLRDRGRFRPLDPRLSQRLLDQSAWMEQADGGLSIRDAVSRCVGKLSEEQRRLVAARYGGEHEKVEQLARRFGRSPGGVYQLLHRIRLMLRACVERRLAVERRS